jgi:hypothetical protein
MEEFAKMIYKKWFEEEAGNLSWGDYDKAVTKIHEILKEELAEEIECSINKNVWDIQERAFIAGFSYACKCLSNGKIEF